VTTSEGVDAVAADPGLGQRHRPDEFKAKVITALRRLQKMPHIVRRSSPTPTCATSPHDQVS
jgi:hypothetical protein